MRNWTEDDLKAIQSKRQVSKLDHGEAVTRRAVNALIAGSNPAAPATLPDVSAPPFKPPHVAGVYGRGRMPKGQMNGLETAYAAHLTMLERAGEIQWFKFEPVTWRLADRCSYTPDFMVLDRDGFIECHETKGFWREDARLKIKFAAKHLPFKFIGVQKDGKGWKREEFSR